MRVALLSILVSLAACGGTPPAAPPAAPPATASPAAAAGTLVELGEAKVGDRTTCLISREEFTVTASSPKVEHAGKTYYFCCAGCDKKFAADPAKYLGRSK